MRSAVFIVDSRRSLVGLDGFSQLSKVVDGVRYDGRVEFEGRTSDGCVSDQCVDPISVYRLRSEQSGLQFCGRPADFLIDRDHANPLERRADRDRIECVDEFPADGELFEIDRRRDVLRFVRLGLGIRRDRLASGSVVDQERRVE